MANVNRIRAKMQLLGNKREAPVYWGFPRDCISIENPLLNTLRVHTPNFQMWTEHTSCRFLSGRCSAGWLGAATHLISHHPHPSGSSRVLRQCQGWCSANAVVESICPLANVFAPHQPHCCLLYLESSSDLGNRKSGECCNSANCY